jgi:hypothetical protein
MLLGIGAGGGHVTNGHHGDAAFFRQRYAIVLARSAFEISEINDF